jgi:hypothetical protein
MRSAKKYILILVILSSCSTTNDRNSSLRLRAKLKTNNFTNAVNIVTDENFYSGERNRLLKELETGTVFYLDGQYLRALQHFQEAKRISNELYTESISKKIAGTFIASADNYYGERYERSLVRFYESLVNYNLFLETQKRSYLDTARAITDEWDSILTSYKNELGGIDTYKIDLTQKLFGAYLNKISGRKQVAIQLYKDAKQVLERNYSSYPTYNNNYEIYNKDYAKLPTLSPSTLSKYINYTDNAESLLNFIDEQMADLNKNSFTVVVKEGYIAPKKAIKVVIGNHYGMDEDADDDTDIIPLIVPSNVFGLITTAMIGYPPELGWIIGNSTTIEFEVPFVPYISNNNSYNVVLKGQNEYKIPLVIMNPLSDIAAKEINDKRNSALMKAATKVIVLHATAITAAKIAYEAGVEKKMNRLLLIASVLGAYETASAGINKMTEADLRYWSSLAGNILIGGKNIPNGIYNLSILNKNGKEVYKKNNVKVFEGGFLDINI